LETNRFRDTQSSGVTSGQNRSMLGTPHATEEVQDFLRAQNNKQLLGFFGAGIASSNAQSFLRETL
jgi:hypothetical protein